MKTPTTNAQKATFSTSSEEALILQAEVVASGKATRNPALAALNARLNADAARVSRLAAANTIRIAGKDML
jgi:hypothetical protein